jgi:hypothetical protein
MIFDWSIKTRKKDPWKMCIDVEQTFRNNEIHLEHIDKYKNRAWTKLVMDKFEPGVNQEPRCKDFPRFIARSLWANQLNQVFLLFSTAYKFHEKARVIVNSIKKELNDAWEARNGPQTQPPGNAGPSHSNEPNVTLSSLISAGPSMTSRPHEKEPAQHLTTRPYQPSPALPTNLPTLTPGDYYSYGASYYSADMHSQGPPPSGSYPHPQSHPHPPTGYDPSAPMMYNAGWIPPPPPLAPPPLPSPAFGRPSEIKASVPAEPVKTPPVLPPPRPLNSFTANMVIPAFKGGSSKKLTDPASDSATYVAFRNASPAFSAFGQSSSKGSIIGPAPGSSMERRM